MSASAMDVPCLHDDDVVETCGLIFVVLCARADK